MVAILPGDGLFAFSGLEAGRWIVSAFYSGTAIAPVPLATVTVEAERTTWIDLDGLGPVHLHGRVLDERGPVAGAQVRLSTLWTTTDADGRFEFRTSFPLTMWVEFEVAHGGVSYEFEAAPMSNNAQELEADLWIGGRQLTVLARDEHDAPTRAEVTVSTATLARDSPPERPRYAPSQVSAQAPVPLSGTLTFDNMPLGFYRVVATFPSGLEIRQGAAQFIDTTDRIVVRALPTGDLDLTLRTHDGQPATWLSIEIESWRGPGEIPASGVSPTPPELHRRTAHADARGRALLRGVVAGRVRVSVHDQRARFLLANETWPEAPTPQLIDLAPGEEAQLVFELPPP